MKSHQTRDPSPNLMIGRSSEKNHGWTADVNPRSDIEHDTNEIAFPQALESLISDVLRRANERRDDGGSYHNHEAAASVLFDIRDGEMKTRADYARIWGWTYETVRYRMRKITLRAVGMLQDTLSASLDDVRPLLPDGARSFLPPPSPQTAEKPGTAQPQFPQLESPAESARKRVERRFASPRSRSNPNHTNTLTPKPQCQGGPRARRSTGDSGRPSGGKSSGNEGGTRRDRGRSDRSGLESTPGASSTGALTEHERRVRGILRAVGASPSGGRVRWIAAEIDRLDVFARTVRDTAASMETRGIDPARMQIPILLRDYRRNAEHERNREDRARERALRTAEDRVSTGAVGGKRPEDRPTGPDGRRLWTHGECVDALDRLSGTFSDHFETVRTDRGVFFRPIGSETTA